jgi:hypothetical protein
MAPRKPRGRPRKGTPTGKTASLTFRAAPDLRKMLEESRDDRGVTLSQEIEERLRQSFAFNQERDRLEAEFAKERAALNSERKRYVDMFGGEQNYAYCRCISVLMQDISRITGRDWTKDVWTGDQVRDGVMVMFSAWRPGEPDLQGEKPTPPPGARSKIPDNLGEALAANQLAIMDFIKPDRFSDDPWARIASGMRNPAKEEN